MKRYTKIMPYPGFRVEYEIKKRILRTDSKYQEIEIIDNPVFGRMLFLDGDLQISEAGDQAYNLNLFSSLFYKDNKILILGGGDGAVLKRIFDTHKHFGKGKKRVTLVDRQVVLYAKKYLKCLCGNALDDERVKIEYMDALEFVKKQKARQYDHVIYDLTMNPNFFKKREKYIDALIKHVKRVMKWKGSMTMQCCSAKDMKTRKFTEKIIRKYFKHPVFSDDSIPGFLEDWVFAGVSKS